MSDYPTEIGGGWYVLSNGESVQGLDKARRAEIELDEDDVLEPVETSAWRDYPQYSCPVDGCAFSQIQNPRQSSARAVVERHIESVHLG